MGDDRLTDAERLAALERDLTDFVLVKSRELTDDGTRYTLDEVKAMLGTTD